MLEYTDFGWWQAREEGSAVSLMLKSESSSSRSGFWPWFSENSTMEEILEQLGNILVCGVCSFGCEFMTPCVVKLGKLGSLWSLVCLGLGCFLLVE